MEANNWTFRSLEQCPAQSSSCNPAVLKTSMGRDCTTIQRLVILTGKNFFLVSSLKLISLYAAVSCHPGINCSEESVSIFLVTSPWYRQVANRYPQRCLLSKLKKPLISASPHRTLRRKVETRVPVLPFTQSSAFNLDICI